MKLFRNMPLFWYLIFRKSSCLKKPARNSSSMQVFLLFYYFLSLIAYNSIFVKSSFSLKLSSKMPPDWNYLGICFCFETWFLENWVAWKNLHRIQVPYKFLFFYFFFIFLSLISYNSIFAKSSFFYWNSILKKSSLKHGHILK